MKSIKKIIAGMCLCLCTSVFVFGNIAYAKSDAEKAVQDFLSANPDAFMAASECKTELLTGNPDKKVKGFEPELKEFMEFLDANFKNESSTSSLTSLAIARYREYRDALRSQFKHVQIAGIKAAEADTNAGEFAWGGAGSLPEFDTALRSYALCEEMVNTYISLGRQEMLKHIKKSAAQKKTIMLLEKFKTLNTKLRNLNMKIAELAGLYATFKNKFPGFAPKSCMKSL